MRPLVIATIVFLLATAACSTKRAAGVEAPLAARGENQLRVGGKVVTIEIANTAEQRRAGLMFRKALEEDSGMLFIYPTARPLSFWMQNTLIPLSIAFLRDDGRIINIEEMQAMTETSHHSSEPCRFALEMSSHWFDQNGVRRGDRIDIPERIVNMEAEHD